MMICKDTLNIGDDIKDVPDFFSVERIVARC